MWRVFYILRTFRRNSLSGRKRRSALATVHSFLLNIGHWQLLIELPEAGELSWKREWKRDFAALTVFLLITLGICVLCGCSRPTAANLADVATTLLALVQEAANEGADAESAYLVSTWLQINSNNYSAFD